MTSVLKAATHVRCRLFGQFAIEGPAGPIRIRGRRGRALIAYLALAGPGGVGRERLSGVLWSDRGEEQARASLRQCVLELRRELADAGLDLLDVGREHLALRRAGVTTDVADLEAAIAAHDTATLAGALRAIGSTLLLEDLAIGGLFDEWVARTRAQLESLLEREVRRAVQAAEGAGAWAQLGELAEAYLLRSPADEVVVAAAIRADMAMGVTSSAHRRFRTLESTLAQEYGLRPGATVSQALTAPAGAPPPVAKETETRMRHSPSKDHTPPIVVVGPFEGAQFGDPSMALAEAVRDEVVSGLARFRDLAVVTDPSAAAGLDPAAFDVPELVFVLAARLRAGARPGITVQLTRLQTHDVVWSGSFELPESAILSAIDVIVGRVVAAVLPSIDLHLAPPRRDAESASSYVRHLRAKWRALNATTYEQAVAVADELEELIAAYPRFPLPYVTLAYLYNTDFNYTRACSSDLARREKALQLAKTAISLDRGHSHGYVVAAWSYLRMRRWDLARQLFDQAFELNPFHPTRIMEIGFGLLFLDERDRARALLDRCLLVNPTPQDNYFMDLGLLELVCGAGERAATYFELVAAPALWNTIHMAINAELHGPAAPDLSLRARARIAAIWPSDRAMTDDAVIDWIMAHHPFQSPAVEAQFVAGARRLLQAA